MFEAILLTDEHPNWEEFVDSDGDSDEVPEYLFALSFNDTKERGDGIVHSRLEGDERQTCAEYNARVVGKVARNQNWCSGCTEIIMSRMVVKDCHWCYYDQIIRRQYEPGGVYTLNNPDWWSVQDYEIHQLWNNETTFGEDGLSPWPIPVNHSKPALELLGLSPDCPVCFGMAYSIIQQATRDESKRIKILGISPRRHSVEASEIMLFRDQGVFNFKIMLDYYNGLPPFKCGCHYDHVLPSFKSGMVDVALLPISDTNGPSLASHQSNRYNPVILARHIHNQFRKYPVENLQQTAEYAPSFRLIDVKQRCVVHIGNNHVRYSAISYRWDSTDKNMLTSKTQQKFAQPGSLSLKTMSKTLYDCMTMAQYLEIPYIWIDRYCIMQGDDREKAEQIHAMGDVYANSYLTMICALSTDIHSGIPGYTRTFDGRWNGFNLVSCLGISAGELGQIIDGSEWYTRGWTMQEEYLSPRRLYFTDSTILWHINCPMAAYQDVPFTDEPECRIQCLEAKSISPLTLIQDYCRRKLTFPGDRINAIAGLLKTRGIDHISGIPTRGMQHSLCWFVAEREFPVPFIDQFPSWSWASRDSRVDWIYCPAPQDWAKWKILHAHTRPQKRISLLRQMGLPISVFDNLSDSRLLIRMPAKRIQGHNVSSGDIDFEFYRPPSPCWAVPMSRGYCGKTAYLLLEPFIPQEVCSGGGFIHARRIGWLEKFAKYGFGRFPEPDRYIEDYYHPPLGRLAKARPMAIQTLTILKRRRIPRLVIHQTASVKWKKEKVFDRQQTTSRHFDSILPLRHKCPDSGGSEVDVMDSHGGIVNRSRLSTTKERKRRRQALRQKRRKPVRRPFFGYNLFRDQASGFRNIMLH